MRIEDNTNCIECGNAFELHSTYGARCPKNGGFKINGKLEFFATHFEPEISEADQLRARIDELTAEKASLTADAKLNDMAWKDNQAALNKQAEEIRTLKQELETIKSCKHMHVKIHYRLFRPSTREEPAEYEYKAECKDCGELFSADDVDEWAEVEE